MHPSTVKSGQRELLKGCGTYICASVFAPGAGSCRDSAREASSSESRERRHAYPPPSESPSMELFVSGCACLSVCVCVGEGERGTVDVGFLFLSS